jgi:hypothetical protein
MMGDSPRRVLYPRLTPPDAVIWPRILASSTRDATCTTELSQFQTKTIRFELTAYANSAAVNLQDGTTLKRERDGFMCGRLHGKLTEIIHIFSITERNFAVASKLYIMSEVSFGFKVFNACTLHKDWQMYDLVGDCVLRLGSLNVRLESSVAHTIF